MCCFSQYLVVWQVCNMAGINPAEISYVEAHGTGTVAGDGQEMDAINKWYGRAPGRTEPVLIGSVKSNMGHCEGASCLASEPPRHHLRFTPQNYHVSQTTPAACMYFISPPSSSVNGA